MLTMTFEGGQDMLKRLEQLSTAVSRKVQRDALKAAAEPMRDRMEILAAPRGQRFQDPIAISNATGTDTHEVAVAVGPTKAFFYGFEYGTKDIPAKPFARPAFDNTVATALGILQSKMWEALRKRLPTSFGSSGAGTVGGRFE